VVLDQFSGAPLAHVTVHALDYTQIWQETNTDAHGRFTVHSVPGTVYLTVDPPNGYGGAQAHVAVTDQPVTGVVVELYPQALVDRLQGTGDAAVEPGLAVLALAGVLGAVVALRARRRAEGRSPKLLSGFGRFVLRRALLIPAQLGALMVVLYIFGSYLPALAIAGHSGCLSVAGSGCSTCDPGQALCQLSVFWTGLAQYLVAIFSGQWGVASIGNFRAPAVDFLSWWLPNSLELAAVALALSVVVGYPLGIAAGWRTNGLLDRSVRSVSIVLLLVPTFLVVLFLLILAYNPWLQYVGDTPYGLLPNPVWFLQQGTFPTWLGFAEQTTPTGFPLIDGMLHGAWPFVVVIASKLAIQALAITLIYVPIFLRYARHSVAEAARSDAVRAARSRGVPEVTLEWRHTGRRTLPIYLLVFGMTLPAYIGTQALVEVLFNDTQGFGTILFSEMTQIGRTGFAVVHHGPVPMGNLYQIAILFLALVLLIGNLCADVLARYLDPTLDEEARR
jgi:peptide/nickel transport system permease protein